MNDICYICNETCIYNENEIDTDEEKFICKLKCGHIFHYSCIYMSYKYTNDKKCPYCRQEGGSIYKLRLCKEILKNGKNKGKLCNCKIKTNDLYCGRHIKKNK